MKQEKTDFKGNLDLEVQNGSRFDPLAKLDPYPVMEFSKNGSGSATLFQFANGSFIYWIQLQSDTSDIECIIFGDWIHWKIWNTREKKYS